MSLQYFRELFHYLGFSYNKRGLYLTLKLFYLKFDNRFFDLRYGIDSSQNVSLDKLNFQIKNKTEGVEYGTIAPYFIQKILELVKFDTSDNSIFDIATRLKGEEDSISKYYIYLIPVIMFVVPFIVNIWARCEYIGFNDEYSIAYGFLSAVVPVR